MIAPFPFLRRNPVNAASRWVPGLRQDEILNSLLDEKSGLILVATTQPNGRRSPLVHLINERYEERHPQAILDMKERRSMPFLAIHEFFRMATANEVITVSASGETLVVSPIQETRTRAALAPVRLLEQTLSLRNHWDLREKLAASLLAVIEEHFVPARSHHGFISAMEIFIPSDKYRHGLANDDLEHLNAFADVEEYYSGPSTTPAPQRSTGLSLDESLADLARNAVVADDIAQRYAKNRNAYQHHFLL